jgi:hypothetical protein
MWTENNNGIDLPENMDASEHSGAIETEIHPVELDPMEKCAHDGAWTDGELPGGRKIKHCTLCGFWKDAVQHIGNAIGEAKFGA